MRINLLLFLCIFYSILDAQEPTLDVKSIDLSLQESSYPQWLTESQDYIYFTANDGIRGRELWKLDKISNKASIVKEIKEGANSSFSDYFELGGVLPDNVMIFFPSDSPDGSLVSRRLWRTDGTAEGTFKILDIAPGMFNNNIYVKYFDEIYFTGGITPYGQNLWKTDGTIEGTHELKFNGESLNQVSHIFEFNNELYFTAKYNEQGLQLWKTNDTSGGIELVSMIGNNEYTGILGYNSFIPFNNYLYFYANDGINGNELWRTNGELNGTEIFKDIFPGVDAWGQPNNSSVGFNAIGQDGYFLFSATENEMTETLYRSDGTIDGTYKIVTTNNQNLRPQFYNSFDNIFAKLGSKTIFKANKQNSGEVLWVTDGTSAGTLFLNDFYPGNNISNISDFTIVNDHVYFLADESFDSGNKLWKTDGTPQGTVKVSDSRISSNILHGSNGSFYFGMEDEINGYEVNKFISENEEFFFTDNANKLGSTLPQNFIDFDGRLFFTSNDKDLYITDGSLEGTQKINSNDIGLSVFRHKIINDKIYFSAYNDNGNQLFKYDDSNETLELVKQFEGGDHTSIFGMGELNDNLIFHVRHQNTDAVWRSDGTTLGTTKIEGTDNFGGGNFIPITYNNSVYFSGYFPEPHSIYKTDGTQSGTSQALIFPGNAFQGTERATILEKFKDGFLISNYESNHIRGNLYFSKGAQSNTIKLIDVGGPIYNYIGAPYGTIIGDKFIFFAAKQEAPYTDLFVTDATVSGTHSLNKSYRDIYHVIGRGNYAYFINSNSDQMEIHQTDGTSEGTFKIDEFNYMKQYEEEYKNFFTCSDNNYLFYAPNQHNTQVKVTNGMSSKVYDLNFINETPFSGDQRERIKYLHAQGDTLYMSIYKRDNGAELYTTSIEDIVLSVDDLHSNINDSSSNIVIYPNPTKEIAKVKTLDNSKINLIKISDMAGKTVYKKEIKPLLQTEINLNNLNKGIYLVEVFTSNGKETKKIIIN